MMEIITINFGHDSIRVQLLRYSGVLRTGIRHCPTIFSLHNWPFFSAYEHTRELGQTLY